MRDARPSQTIVATLARELLDDCEPMIAELVGHIQEAEPLYRGDLADDLRESVGDNLRSALSDLADERPSNLESARRTARRRAEQGVPLEAVLHAFGMAFRTIWNHMVDIAMSHGRADLQELLRGGAVVWDAIDAHSALVATEYRERVAQLARRDQQQRTAYVGAVLDGRVSEWSLASSAPTAIALPSQGEFVVAAIESSSPSLDELLDVEHHLARNGVASAWAPRFDGLTGIVAIRPQHPLHGVLDLLRNSARRRIGVSPSFHGLHRAQDAVTLAIVARNSLAAGRHGLATFDSRPVAALAAASPRVVAAQVVETVLGGVLALAEEERDLLLETLQAWFDHGGSTSAAGVSLFCHRNTVRNRLNRVLEVTGRDVADPRDVAELHAALLARRIVSADPIGIAERSN